MSHSAQAFYPDLAQQTAIVTGGSKGIGLTTALELAANQVKVALVARSPEGLEVALAQVRDCGGTGLAVQADCTDAAALAAMVAEVSATLGPPQILMAFAGGFERTTPILEISEAEWRRVIDQNLTSTFLPLASRRGAAPADLVAAAGGDLRHRARAPVPVGRQGRHLSRRRR
jgi:3-oxoacyl-[acyl-carrier protein] reductase